MRNSLIYKRCKQWKKTSAIEKFEKFHLWNITQKKFEGRAKGREQWIFEKNYFKKKERRNKFRKKYDKCF